MKPIIPETDTPPEEVAEHVGQTAIEKTVDKVEPENKNDKPLVEEIIAGFEAKDPKGQSSGSLDPAKKDGKAAKPDRKVTVMIVAGLATVVIGLIMLFIFAAFGILLILIGAGVLIFGVYKPISQKLAKLPAGGQK